MIHIWHGGTGGERPRLCQALQKEFGVGWVRWGGPRTPHGPQGQGHVPRDSLCPASGHSGPHGRPALPGRAPCADLTPAACAPKVWEGWGLQPESMWPTSRGGHEGAAGPYTGEAPEAWAACTVSSAHTCSLLPCPHLTPSH